VCNGLNRGIIRLSYRLLELPILHLFKRSSFAVLLVALFLAGCATAPHPVSHAAPEPVVQALRSGDCRGASQQLLAMSSPNPDWLVQGAQVCLQVGNFRQSRELAYLFLARAEPFQETDYGAYLHAMAGFGEWSRSLGRDPQRQVTEGRALFQEILAYLDERPLSDYIENLAPRLVRLREGIAAGELALAQQHYGVGDIDIGKARAEYVVNYFPRTQAAADSALWLLQIDASVGNGAHRRGVLR